MPITPNPSSKHTGNCCQANLIGRISLYGLTLFLICFSVSIPLSAYWVFAPAHWHPAWYIATYRLVLGAGFLFGFVLFVNLFILHRVFVKPRGFLFSSLKNARVHVCLTAYNDETCIADAVKDFKSNPSAHRLIVTENNSKDRTRQAAIDAGADSVITEMIPGYGSCCQRAMQEAAKDLSDNDVIILCEGDMTFSGHDIQKFLAYLENCDLVLGTRATQELRETNTQMDWLINPGNQIVAKLIQTRFWGTRLTDVGCTYRAMRVGSYRQLKDNLRVLGNHFSPHMYIEALKLRMRVIEIPVVFKHRAGLSKGVGSNKIKATKVALRMLTLLYTA